MKKIVSLVIIISMMLCMFPISSMTATAETTEFQQVDLSEYADGDTYTDKNGIAYEVIRTFDNFKSINRTKNCIFACDISGEGRTLNSNIFGEGVSISGIVDGNGYALYNFSTTYTGGYGTAGLLTQSLKGNATIRNLTIGKPDMPITYNLNGVSLNTVGALVGKIHEDTTAGQKVTISNVHIYCNMEFQKAYTQQGISLGGFIGITNGSNGYTVEISDSSFDGSIKFPASAAVSDKNTRIGGFVGYHQNGSIEIIDSCNYANIDATNRTSGSNGVSYIGGLVGDIESSVSFKNCSNSGAITSDKYSGGVAGYVKTPTTFDGCSNSGVVTATAYSGGIVGRVYSTVDFTSCTNTGMITSHQYSGGIAGGAYFVNSTEQANHKFTFSNCTNHGNIIAQQSGTTKNSAGGIVGNVNFGQCEITGCGNTGDISASTTYNCSTPNPVGASGILGYGYVNQENVATISDCFSTGKIIAAGEYGETAITANAICSISAAGKAVIVTNCVWDMTFNQAKITSGASGKISSASFGNEARNLLAKTTSDGIEACIQKSNDNTKIRVLLLSNTDVLATNTDVTVKVWCGNTGKQFTVPANKIFALESVDAAGEMYYGVGGAYIFGAVITGIPTEVMDTVTDVTVEYGSYSADFTIKE